MAATQRFCFNSSSLGAVETFRVESSTRSSRLTARASGSDRSDQTDSTSDGNGSSTGTDWDKAWTSYKKETRRKPLFGLDMEQHVSRKPIHRNFSVTEEVDEFRKSERATLDAWTNPKFTYAGFSVILGLFVYMVINTPHA